MSEIKISKIGDTYLIADAPYESHRRGKNWAARIVGLSVKYRFARSFLEKGGEKGQYVLKEKPSAGDIFYFAAIYRSCSGNPSSSPESGYYQLQADGTFKKELEEDVKAKYEIQNDETF